MERKMIISLLIGYITALLPIWDWNGRLELFAGTIVLSIASLIVLIWIREKTEKIKEALAPANERASKQ